MERSLLILALCFTGATAQFSCTTCTWIRGVIAIDSYINSTQLSWSALPVALPLTDYLSPTVSVETGSATALGQEVKVQSYPPPTNDVYTTTIDVTESGEFSLVAYSENGETQSALVKMPEWEITDQEFAVTFLNYGSTESLTVTVAGNESASFAVPVKGYVARVFPLPTTQFVNIGIRTESGLVIAEPYQFTHPPSELRHIIAFTVIGEQGDVLLRVRKPSYLSGIGQPVYPPVDNQPDDDESTCLSILTGCGTLAIGETSTCPSGCSPCARVTECDTELSQSDYGNSSTTSNRGGWSRIKSTCCDGDSAASLAVSPLVVVGFLLTLLL